MTWRELVMTEPAHHTIRISSTPSDSPPVSLIDRHAIGSMTGTWMRLTNGSTIRSMPYACAPA